MKYKRHKKHSYSSEYDYEDSFEVSRQEERKISFNCKQSNKFFEGRNIIKKVKTHGIKLVITALTTCIEFKNSKKRKWKVNQKKKIFKIFKSDISKNRNRSILDVPIKEVLRTFSNINLNSQSFSVIEAKRKTFDFLINMTWYDLLLLLKRGNKEILNLVGIKMKRTLTLTREEIQQYLSYINEGGNLKDRVNLNKEYLVLYSNLERKEDPLEKLQSEYLMLICD